MTSQAVLIDEDLEHMATAVELEAAGPVEGVSASPAQARLRGLIEQSRNGQRTPTRRLRVVSRLGAGEVPVAQRPHGDVVAPAVPSWNSSEWVGDTGRVQEWLEEGQPAEDLGFRSLGAESELCRSVAGATSLERVEQLANRLPEVLSEALVQLEQTNDKRADAFLSNATREFDGRMDVMERTLDQLGQHLDRAAARAAQPAVAAFNAPPPREEIGALRTELTLKMLTLLFASVALFSLVVIVRGIFS